VASQEGLSSVSKVNAAVAIFRVNVFGGWGIKSLYMKPAAGNER
jgi:hypothetical protein